MAWSFPPRDCPLVQPRVLTGVDGTHLRGLVSTPLPKGLEAGVPAGRGRLPVSQLRPGASPPTSSQALFRPASSCERRSGRGGRAACVIAHRKKWQKGLQPQVLSARGPRAACQEWGLAVFLAWRLYSSLPRLGAPAALGPLSCVSQVMCCLLFSSPPLFPPAGLRSSGGGQAARHLLCTAFLDFLEWPRVEG